MNRNPVKYCTQVYLMDLIIALGYSLCDSNLTNINIIFLQARMLNNARMNPVIIISTDQHSIQNIIADKFGVQLSPVQLIELIDAQPEAIRKALQETALSSGSLDLLVENIAEEITGILYPTEHSTLYHGEYIPKKLKENKGQYNGLPS